MGNYSLSYSKLLLLAACCIFTMTVTAQPDKRETRKYYDAERKEVKRERQATSFTVIRRIDAKTWQYLEYRVNGPCIRMRYCNDWEGAVNQGLFAAYHANGYADSIGYYDNGLQNRSWLFFDVAGKALREKIYQDGKIVKTREYDADGNPPRDSVAVDPEERESSFKGGQDGWLRYLLKNLTYPIDAMKARTMGTVVTRFVVNAAGQTSDIAVFKSVDYLLDEESVRMIQISPPWEPARQFGRPVKTYKLQPIIFRML